jgi:predicted outer membrane protein
MKSFIAASAIVVAGACLVAAQQPNTDQQTPGTATSQVAPGQSTPDQQNRPDQQNQAGDRASRGRHDLNFYITDCLIDANRAEITLARLAEQRATDPEVKQFAQRAIQDHTQFLNKLQQAQGNGAGRQSNDQSATGQNPAGDTFAPRNANSPQNQASDQTNRVQPTSGQTSDQSATGGPAANTNAAANQVAGQAAGELNGKARQNGHMDQRGGARQFVQLQKEIHARCLQSMTQELSQKEGARFDKCYINGQVAAHMAMADHLAVFSKSGDENLQTLCQEGLQTTQQHLQMAKQIANRLDGNAAAPASANSNTNTNPQQQ